MDCDLHIQTAAVSVGRDKKGCRDEKINTMCLKLRQVLTSRRRRLS